MPEISSPPAAVSATQRVASWLTHMGVSTYAFDDTLGLINPLWTVTRLHARVVTKTAETPSAMTVVLQAGGAFQGLKPGQFVMIGVEINGVRHRRAYSPRSIDGRSDRFAITVQRQAGGKVSNFVHDKLQPGDIIEIEQAGGEFTLPRQTPAEVLLVAGGSGITPCMSILEHLRRERAATRVTLIYFARSRADRIFARTLESLAAQWPALRYVPLESTVNTPGVSTAADTAATLSTELLSELQPQWAALPAYCCGPAPLMDAARQIWKDAGASDHLRLEAFAAARPSGDPSVRHQVRIVRGDLPMAFEAPASETILVAGEQAGHAIKHGCRQGICHECTCRLNSGAVRDLTTGEQIHGEGQPVRLCVSAALSDLSLESLN
ncbi:MAG: ferredoxin reductase [Aquabacterium sp.]|jgi:stearoyl-CoA 9-desaturase NADPH oxidoreductase|uniref:ferredoxin reductase n=1 Tax=Aquabacterium sp. TaxID=1872578 RepID=UPI003BAE65B6